MNVCVLGGGSWGATFARLLSKLGNSVTIWEYDINRVEELKTTRSLKILPQLKLPEDVHITNDRYEAVRNKDVIVIAVPSRFVGDTLESIDAGKAKILSLTKGFDTSGFRRISQVILSKTGKSPTVLSGPSHAEEVCIDVPTAVTVAGADADFFQNMLNTKFFRVYKSDDITGVELGGALKNIYAIVKGIVDGMGFGDNTKAAVITRSLYEMVKVGVALGAKPHTFFGLSGIGDLIVTAYSIHSRNRAFGEKIGSGMDIKKALENIGMVVEGYETVKIVPHLKKLNLDIPLAEGLYQILFLSVKPVEIIEAILSRPIKGEWNIKFV